MDLETQKQFDEIVAMDQNTLNDQQKGFLMARRSYLNDEQRKRYAEMIEEAEGSEETEGGLESLTVAKLKAVAKEEEIDVTGLTTKADLVEAITEARA